MQVTFQWNKPKAKIMKEATGDSAGLLFLASEARRLMDPYVPADHMMLSQNVRIYVDGDEGIVEYASPYAHYQFIGELYVSSTTGSSWSRGEYKIPAGRRLKYTKFRHPLATSHWDKAMMTARKNDLARAYQTYLNRGVS